MLCVDDAYCSTGTVAAHSLSLSACANICTSNYSAVVFSYSEGNECSCGSTDQCRSITIQSSLAVAVYASSLGVSLFEYSCMYLILNDKIELSGSCGH